MQHNPYLAALGFKSGDDPTMPQVKTAYAALAQNGEHPDRGGDAARWTLITAAYNEIKAIAAKKRGGWGRNGDASWLRNWQDLGKPATTEQPAPKTDKPKSKRTGYASTHATGTKSDSSQRCGAHTASGDCIRPSNHPHGHMSATTRDRKTAAAKAKKSAAAE